MPRLAIRAVQSALGIVLEAEEQAGAGEDCLDGEDEPGVLGDDVGDQEIYFRRVVGDHVAVGAAVRIDVVAAVEDRGGGFYLDAPEAFSGVDDNVVAFTVAEGLGQAESQSSSFQHKCHFGQFATAFGCGLVVAGGFTGRCHDERGLAFARESVVFFHNPKKKRRKPGLAPFFLINSE